MKIAAAAAAPLTSLLAFVAAASLALPVHAQAPPATPPTAADPFALTPDSKTQDGVPKGEVLHFTFDKSKVFPGTVQDYWVYVPAQYSPDKPACLYVNQDGQQWNAHTVFDNLIAKKEMPVTIGVFVMHGRVKAADPKTALDRFNRSYEYDGLGDNYARFLLDELLPEVETKKTSDGRAIHFSHDGNDRGIGGSSSGAIAAFTAAWERPDAFSRVFSVIGTYVGLRGGEVYPTLIRKTEPKPLRVFLEDGSNDLNIYGGDWWMANQTMERALTFAGYEVNHVYGTHGHDGRQGSALFPDAMRWLWKDWPQPVKAGESKNAMLQQILAPGETWRAVSADDYRKAFPSAAQNSLDPHSVTLHGGVTYSVESSTGKPSDVAGVLMSRGGEKNKVAAKGDQKAVGGITASPDHTLLYVSDAASHWVWSYQIQPDGSLAYGQKYYWLHSPDTADDAGAGGMCVDKDGRLYVATRMGVQVADQAGRVNVILPLPENRAAENVRLGGPTFDTLFVTSGDRVFARKLKATGANLWDVSIRPAPPGL